MWRSTVVMNEHLLLWCCPTEWIMYINFICLKLPWCSVLWVLFPTVLKYDTLSEIHILSLFSGLVSAVQQPHACAFHSHLHIYVVVHGLCDFYTQCSINSVHTSCHLDSVVNVWAEGEAKQLHTFIATVIVSIYQWFPSKNPHFLCMLWFCRFQILF